MQLSVKRRSSVGAPTLAKVYASGIAARSRTTPSFTRASVGAGAVVTSDVAPYALVVGVPARRVGWVGEAGVPLVAADEVPRNEAGDRTWVCPASGRRYVERDGTLSPEAAPASSSSAPVIPDETREEQP